MYRLYGEPGRASAAPEALLEQIGVAFEYVHTDADARQSAAYRALNPLGQVPTLVDGDRVLSESAAICMYLCDRHPEAGLAPPCGSPDRGRFYQWLLFLATTLQPAYMRYIYPDRYGGDAEAVAAAAATRIAELWQRLDGALDPGPFLLGGRASACDIYLYMLSTWHRETIVPLAKLSHVSRNLEGVAAMPGVVRMMARNAGH